MAIIEVLTSLMDGEIFGDSTLFKEIYGDKEFEILSESIKDFHFYDNGQSVIIYDGRSVVYDCNYAEYYCKKQLTTCYCRTGLFFDFSN